MFEHKDAIAHAVGDKITHSMADFGWRILQSLVINVDPDQSVKTAMNTLQAAEKQRIASETTAEAQKFVRVKAAEADAMSKALQVWRVPRLSCDLAPGPAPDTLAPWHLGTLRRGRALCLVCVCVRLCGAVASTPPHPLTPTVCGPRPKKRTKPPLVVGLPRAHACA